MEQYVNLEIVDVYTKPSIGYKNIHIKVIVPRKMTMYHGYNQNIYIVNVPTSSSVNNYTVPVDTDLFYELELTLRLTSSCS